MNLSMQLRRTVHISLMAALIAVGAFLAIPIGPVPIVLQNMFVLLAGLLFGGRWGLACVAVYLLAGACGLPVFSGGTGGPGRLVGPTGGYLWGYLPAVYVTGWIANQPKPRALTDVLAMVCACLIVYAFGVTWLKILTGMSLGKTVSVGLLPFLPGDALKIAAAVPIARALRPVVEISPHHENASHRN